jgi:C1q domain
MASIINASSSGSGGIVQTADASGVLQLQTNGTVGVILDASANVTIGTTAGTGRLNVKSTGTYADLILSTTSVTTAVFSDQGGLYGVAGTVTNHPMTFIINNGEKMRLSTQGYLTTPSQPAFYAYYSNNALTINAGTMVMDATIFNTGSAYNTSTGIFTAPVAGTYFFSVTWQHYGGTINSSYVDIYKNGAKYGRSRAEGGGIANYTTFGCSVVMQLNANETANLYCAGSGVIWSDNTIFVGYLLG